MILKYIFLIFFVFLKTFSLSNEEKSLISNYLKLDIFEIIIKELSILNSFNLEDLNIFELNKILQKEWFQGENKERWEFETKEFNLNLIEYLNNLYIENNINLNNYDFDLIIIFGSSFYSILERAMLAKKINEKNKFKIIFLTGYRELDKKVDLTGKERKLILEEKFPEKKSFIENLNEDINLEKDLIKQIKDVVFAEESYLNEIEIFSEDIIKGNKRATTESTLKKLLEQKYESIKNKKILAISNIKGIIAYQKSVVDLVLKNFNKNNIEINVIGINDYIIKDDLKFIAKNLDNIARIIYNCCEILKIKNEK